MFKDQIGYGATPIERRPNDMDETVQRQSHHSKYLDQEIGANINRAHFKQKEYYDRGKSPKNLKVGDEVMVQDTHRADSLSPLYQGPYKIFACKGVDVEVEGKVTGRRQEIHNNKIKKVPHEDGSMHLHEEQKNAEPLSQPDHGGSEKQKIQTTPSIKDQYCAGGMTRTVKDHLEGKSLGDHLGQWFPTSGSPLHHLVVVWKSYTVV